MNRTRVVVFTVIGAIAVIAVALGLLLNKHDDSSSSVTAEDASASPSPSLDSCHAAAVDFVTQDLQAFQDGYSSGVNPLDFLREYGQQSKEWQVIQSISGSIPGEVYQKGLNNVSVADFLPRIDQLCSSSSDTYGYSGTS